MKTFTDDDKKWMLEQLARAHGGEHPFKEVYPEFFVVTEKPFTIEPSNHIVTSLMEEFHLVKYWNLKVAALANDGEDLKLLTLGTFGCN